MNKQKSHNFISAILGNKKISRVVLMAYILAPIFIFTVGFASWTIVTPEFGFITNGSFVGNQLLDSTKYISLSDDNQAFTATTTVGGFLVPDEDDPNVTHILDKTTLSIGFDIKLGQCQKLFIPEKGGPLYFTFGLCFADRDEAPDWFKVENFECQATITWKNGDESNKAKLSTVTTDTATADLTGTGVNAKISTLVDGLKETATSSSYVFVLELNFPSNLDVENYVEIDPNTEISITLEYTLTPASPEHYRALLDVLFGGSGLKKSLMSDVRITDYPPYVMK